MHSISNILIANRGEIARRIIRTARSLGISTFAVYTEEEKTALHVQEADHSCSLGSGPLSENYLNIPLIIKIARENNCDAIHPGYGFLSENAGFAEACINAGIIFIGPRPDAIRLMGNKTKARKFVQNLGILLPHSISGDSCEEVLANISGMKFPLIIKAAAGGGGKGMKIVQSTKNFSDAWTSSSRDAMANFGESTVYLEQYIEGARHVEVQILGDTLGNVIHLYDRDCTIQRRHQKIIEEAPSQILPEEVRQKMMNTAVFIVKSMNYTGAGTIEFLIDQSCNFYFLEMNTRIQVEHSVTEAITGIDIVKEQINIANGKPLSFEQNEIVSIGHAIECRIYAEDPFNGFMPSSGTMLLNYLPQHPNIRIDSAFDGPASISSNYDSLITKITSHSDSRELAIKQLQLYLKKAAIQGINTNIEYIAEILDEDDFRQNKYSTSYCELKAETLKQNHANRKKQIDPSQIIASVLTYFFKPGKYSNDTSIWHILGPWRNIATLLLSINQKQYEIAYQIFGRGRIKYSLGGIDYLISAIENQEAVTMFQLNGLKVNCLVSDADNRIYSSTQGLCFEIIRDDIPSLSVFNQNHKEVSHFNGDRIFSPLNGKIIQLNVKEGDKVRKGEILMIIESMKMENKILAPAEAVVAEIKVANGDQVMGSDVLIKLTMLN